MDRGRQKTRNEALAEDLLKEVNQLRQRSASCIHACTRTHARTHTHTHTHTQDRSERKAAMAAATADEVAACTFRLDQLLVYDQYTLVHVLNPSAATQTDVQVARSARSFKTRGWSLNRIAYPPLIVSMHTGHERRARKDPAEQATTVESAAQCRDDDAAGGGE